MSETARIRTLLEAATLELAGSSESPRLDAELLLARAIDMPRSFVYAHADDELDAAAVQRFRESLERRTDGEPLAYICGEKEFWSMPLQVSPATLVPRPETELLVELALSRLSRRERVTVVDLGTGSGAIALAIARERPLSMVTATDLSEAALRMAQLNARQLELGNVEFLAGSWVQPVAGRHFDLIVSNPPYVASEDPALLALKHEPRAALAAGPDGLDAIRELAADCRQIAAPGGWLLLEHGAGQEDGVAGLLQAAGWTEIRCHRDYAGKPRVTAARMP